MKDYKKSDEYLWRNSKDVLIQVRVNKCRRPKRDRVCSWSVVVGYYIELAGYILPLGAGGEREQ